MILLLLVGNVFCVAAPNLHPYSIGFCPFLYMRGCMHPGVCMPCQSLLLLYS